MRTSVSGEDPLAGAGPRRGARSYATVTSETRRHLEYELGQSSTHVEQMAIRFSTLLRSALPDVVDSERSVDKGPFLTRMRRAGTLVWEQRGWAGIEAAADSTSDTVRGWGAFALRVAPDLTPEDRIAATRRFADDAHFAVREWAWLSARDAIVEDPTAYLPVLVDLTGSSSVNLRRFAVEASRPRSVWGAHLALFKKCPEHGRALLDRVAADPHRYVQDATANWLNDVARAHAPWVQAVCASWALEYGPAVARVCKRAQRSIITSP